MESTLHHLDNWVLSPDQSEHLRAQYRIVLSNPQLWQSDALRSAASTFLGQSGIYFWVLSYRGQLHRIYVGKTNSLGYRIQNYAGAFQPHSPNDFKLQVFHDFAQKHYAGSELDMYFNPCAASELTAQENKEISLFKPLLNARMRPDAEARHNLQQAFVAYYASGFATALGSS